MGNFTSRRVRSIGIRSFVAAVVGVTAAPALVAQSASSVRGRVVKPADDTVLPVGHQWVTLHRVGTDTAGPLDSMRTSADGRYRFTYNRTGNDDAVYFVSSSHDGVAYFSLPLKPGATTGDDAEIVVFDTTSRPVPISVRGRHVVISDPLPGGERRVTEVYELSNDSSVTRVTLSDTPEGASWSALMPDGARNPAVAGGDVPASAVQFTQGHVLMVAPFAPGIKQFVFSYTMGDDAFPLTIPVQRATSVFEVLLEEPNAMARGIREVESVSMQGHHFRRFLGSDLAASGTITVTVPTPRSSINPWYLAGLTVLIGGAMTFALARAVRRR